MNAVAELTEAQRVVLLGPNDLPRMWGQIEPLVVKACAWSQGQFSPESVVDGVIDGRYRMLAYVSGEEIASIAVLHISDFSTGLRICELLLASGENLKDWTRFEEKVEAYAKQAGCTKFRMIGREGLQRMLPHYKRVAVVLEREFN